VTQLSLKYVPLQDCADSFEVDIDTLNSDPLDSVWIFPSFPSDTILNGFLKIYDGRGGVARIPLEIVIYSEVHSVWVASTYSPDTLSYVSKLTANGDFIFSVNRFQEVKFLQVFPTSVKGTEALWVVDRTKRSYPASRPFTDTVFILDDDGRVLDSVGGFTTHISGLSLNMEKNIAYVIDGFSIEDADPMGDLTTLQKELEAFKPDLVAKSPLVILTKIDLASPTQIAQLTEKFEKAAELAKSMAEAELRKQYD